MNFCCNDERINSLIRECDWRDEFEDIDICRGMCSPCLDVIDNGKCPTLQEYFREER